METTLFSTAYFAPVQYYWHWRRSGHPVLETHEHYAKQSWRNRCVIGTANGPMTLSVPVEGCPEKKPLRDVRLSDHGNWRHLHWYGIESAYQSSPFFEYYADDLHPFFEKKHVFLLDLNQDIHRMLCDLLDLRTDVYETDTFVKPGETNPECRDLRFLIHPRNPFESTDLEFLATPYYQVFDRKFGFQPNLSILDLLFNMGPEALLYL